MKNVSTAASRAPSAQSLPLLRFYILGAISLVIWFRPLMSSFALASRDEQYTHILLILPVTLTLVLLDWKSFQSHAEVGSKLGIAVLALAALITVVVKLSLFALRPDEQLAVNLLAVVLWWIGSFLFSFGVRAFKRALFPLCFLFWMIPIPSSALNPVVRLLQQGSAAAAHVLFAATGVPVAQDGVLLHIPGLTVEVARECSSIRSSLMLVVTTMVLAQMLLRSPWRKLLVIAVAIPLSVAKNGLRIFVLAMLGTRVDPSFLTGRLHHEGGIIYFLIALAVIVLVLWIVRRGENETPGVIADRDQSNPAHIANLGAAVQAGGLNDSKDR